MINQTAETAVKTMLNKHATDAVKALSEKYEFSLEEALEHLRREPLERVGQRGSVRDRGIVRLVRNNVQVRRGAQERQRHIAALLLDQRLGLHRDVRRRRAEPGPGPVQAGP